MVDNCTRVAFGKLLDLKEITKRFVFIVNAENSRSIPRLLAELKILFEIFHYCYYFFSSFLFFFLYFCFVIAKQVGKQRRNFFIRTLVFQENCFENGCALVHRRNRLSGSHAPSSTRNGFSQSVFHEKGASYEKNLSRGFDLFSDEEPFLVRFESERVEAFERRKKKRIEKRNKRNPSHFPVNRINHFHVPRYHRSG